MEIQILETFPKLEMVPKAIATKFKYMIDCFIQTKRSSPILKTVRYFNRVGMVFDDKGNITCLFKDCKDAKKEAAVYLLDHPISSHRSISSDLIGFGGAAPTVFIRTNETSGCLVSFVENDGVVGKFTPLEFQTVPREISKLCIFHIRFGSPDCNDRNTITKIDAKGIHRLTPVDHEECFTTNYFLRRVWWADKKEANEAFTEEIVNYVEKLDVNRDIIFLKTCGWDLPPEITLPFKIFTFFLKKAVQLHLTANHIVVLAQNNHRARAFNLPNMVADKTHGDEVFLQKSYETIEERLKEYAKKFLHK